MKTVILHGQRHNGSTRNITNLFIEKIKDEGDEVEDFFFSNNSACVGCFNCIMKGREFCPHWEENKHIVEAVLNADLIIMESPCYCMGMSGQLKIFLDHLAYIWMPHRPDERMFKKVGLTVSTAAGAGAAKATKDMAQHLEYWGVSKVFRCANNVGAMRWDDVKNKAKIEKQVEKTAAKIKKQLGKPQTNIKTKFLFNLMGLSQKKNDYNPTDREYWVNHGWLDGKKPWKR